MKILIVSLIISGVIGWTAKLILKRRMERGLGRKVEERELTSISTWMEAIPDEKSSSRGRK